MGKRRRAWDYNEMGVFFYSREACDLAISELKRALRASLVPQPAIYINLGAAYLGKKMYADAAASLREGLRLDPRHQKGHWFLAQALLGLGEASAALAELERVRELDAGNPLGEAAQQEIEHLHKGTIVKERGDHGSPHAL